jgi:pantoate--beta-alanine ligase
MTRARSIAELRAALAARAAGAPVAFVPTLGALHAGHAALFAAARAISDVVVASIFVNPAQFNDQADFAAYPRPEAQDAAIAAAAGVDVLFTPSADDVYPSGHATMVRVRGAADGWEGAFRPGHFDGVATVCLSLFHIVRPASAWFGQKDAQQVAVVRQLLRDTHLDRDVELRVVPTVRESDGLALSSRNARLSPEARASAAAVPRALRAGLAAHRRGDDPVAAARAALDGLAIEYVALAPFDPAPTLILAVRLGSTRLIDNVPLSRPDLAGL